MSNTTRTQAEVAAKKAAAAAAEAAAEQVTGRESYIVSLCLVYVGLCV